VWLLSFAPANPNTEVVSESRQQRRARERKEAKLARRPPAPVPEASASTSNKRIIDIELNRIVLDDDPSDIYVAWAVEWGIRDDSVGTEDNSEDLAELVEGVLSDLRSMAEDYELELEWIVGRDPPAGKTISAEIADLGVKLPSTLISQRSKSTPGIHALPHGH
jgi:hypothetical protein